MTLAGFLNGIDVDGYNPETDPAIPANYSVKNMQGKAKCKQALLEELGLQDGDEPIIGIVTRFVSHKGIDLIRYVFEDILNLGYKFAILGSGEKIFEDFFKEMAWRHPLQERGNEEGEFIQVLRFRLGMNAVDSGEICNGNLFRDGAVGRR